MKKLAFLKEVQDSIDDIDDNIHMLKYQKNRNHKAFLVKELEDAKAELIQKYNLISASNDENWNLIIKSFINTKEAMETKIKNIVLNK